MRPRCARQDQGPDEVAARGHHLGGTGMQIGIAGIGKMGAAIAQRLIEVGHKVTAWNRSADKLRLVKDAGAAVAATPADLAQASDAVISHLTDPAPIHAVYDGAARA